MSCWIWAVFAEASLQVRCHHSLYNDRPDVHYLQAMRRCRLLGLFDQSRADSKLVHAFAADMVALQRFTIPAIESSGEPSILRACEDCYIGCFGIDETSNSGLLGSPNITSLLSMQSSPSSVFSAAFGSLDVLGLWSSNPPSPNLASSGKLPKSQPSSRDLLQDILNKQ